MTSTKSLSYLIVCCRYIGDVLVTTPLALSIKTAQPDALVDYLVFEGTEGILAKNPYVRTVHTIPNKKASIGKLLSLYRQYDVAIAAYPSDRTVVAAAIAGKHSIGLVYNEKKAWWKKVLLSAHRFCDDRMHVVVNIMSLLEPLGIAQLRHVVMGCDARDLGSFTAIMSVKKYVILHPYSRNSCKYWSPEKWGKLARLIQERLEVKVLFTKSPDPTDEPYLCKILAVAPQDAGTFKEPCTLAQLAAVIRGSSAFVGIDTVVTHMAAALEVSTIALYGPSLTRYWAPWPNDCTEECPFAANKGIQRVGCVTVVQKDWPCVPCNREVCSISTEGKMECLEQLSPVEVFAEVEKVLRKSR